MQLEIHKKQVKDAGDVFLLFRSENLHLPRAQQPHKQQLQFCLKWFDEADITTARNMGLEIMQEVASKYLNDKDDDALEQHRDDAIEARGTQVPEKPGFQRTKKKGPPPSKEMMRLRSPSRRATTRGTQRSPRR